MHSKAVQKATGGNCFQYFELGVLQN